MADNLKIKIGSVSNYDSTASKSIEAGTIYFATDTDNRAYIYLNGNNIIPRSLDLRNGGFGADFSVSGVNQYAIYMRGTGDYDSTYVNPAQGAFYTTAVNNIVQKPQFGTLPVTVGGTGKTSLASGAILYGAGTGAINTLAAGTKGYVLISTGSTPKYVLPEMTWTDGTTSGPKFSFKLDGTSFTANSYVIPAARKVNSTYYSGVITTGAQSMTGEKTWNSTTHTANIYPITTMQYSLGYWTSTSDNKIWSNVISRALNIYDSNGYNAGSISSTTAGTTSTQGITNLVLGNSIKSGTAGNSQGVLYLYGTQEGAASIRYGNQSGNALFSLPNPGVSTYLTPSRDSVYNSTSLVNYNIPFYITTDNTMSLGYNNGFILQAAEGTTSTTAGRSELKLGNNIAKGTAGNKRGKLILFGDNTGYTELKSNDSNSTSNYIVSLPAANGELVYHTENSAQGGAGTDTNQNTTYKPVHVSAAGAITAASSTVASGTRLMYMNAGALTASTSNVATGTGNANAGKQLMYLSTGTLTESTANVATETQLMYLKSGVLTASTANVANGKKQLIYLSTGVLTASDADEGSGIKPVYLSDGVITASSSSVAKSTQLMYMTSGTLTASTADVGSATQPVYLLDGVITAADAYTSLLTAFIGSTSAADNTISITVGGTRQSTTIIGGVSNTWTGGTANGPELQVTVNGIASTKAAIPSANYGASGIVTNAAQTFGGVKIFGNGIKIAASNTTTDCATFTYDASTDTLTVSFP